jgi:hypothetical protein
LPVTSNHPTTGLVMSCLPKLEIRGDVMDSIDRA